MLNDAERGLTMQPDRFLRWTLYKAAWHRPDPDRGFHTMCGLVLPISAETTSTEAAAAEIAAHRTTVCGRCERRVGQERAQELPVQASPAAAGTPQQELTPEQQAVKDWLDHERQQRAKARRRAELDKNSSPGKSVHTTSGGLPTLGKGHLRERTDGDLSKTRAGLSYARLHGTVPDVTRSEPANLRVSQPAEYAALRSTKSALRVNYSQLFMGCSLRSVSTHVGQEAAFGALTPSSCRAGPHPVQQAGPGTIRHRV